MTFAVIGLFQPPCVAHAGPALFWPAIKRAGFELTTAQGGPGGFIQSFGATGFFYLRLDDPAVHIDQKPQLYRALFFVTP